MIPEEIKFLEIEKVYKKLSPYVIKTPVIKNSTNLNSFFNTNLFFKLEFLQHSGCFKVRGAINNLLNLTDDQKIKGITAVSAGNHAIASSYATNIFDFSKLALLIVFKSDIIRFATKLLILNLLIKLNIN